MSKAILVMDMPSSCEQCRLHVFGRKYNVVCKATGITQSYDVAYEGKITGCPLREIPQKKELYLSINNEKGYCEGYNACIDEILKGAEENEIN